jgi:hypothetical protein
MATQIGTADEITEDTGDFSHDRIDISRVFEVVYDEAAGVDPQIASLAAGVPTAYSPHPNNLNALLLRKSAQRSGESPRVWIVRCDYSTQLPAAVAQALGTPPGQSGGDSGPQQAADPNPLNRPTRWIAKTVKFSHTSDRDRYGRLIRVSTGERVAQPRQRRKSKLSYVVTKNLPAWDADQMADYSDKVNSQPFLGYGINVVYLDDLYAEQKWENGHRFFEVQATFVIDPHDLHAYVYLDASFNELVSGSLRPIRHRGQPVSQPWPIRNGVALTAEECASNEALVGPRYLTAFDIEERNFHDLGLF